MGASGMIRVTLDTALIPPNHLALLPTTLDSKVRLRDCSENPKL